MIAARIIQPERIEIIETEKPELAGGQILIKNIISAICGSDLPFFLHERPMEYPLPPGVPGHECIGIVAESRCKDYKEGDEVLALPLGTKGFAEYFVSVPSMTVRLPKVEPLYKMVVAQPLGTVIHACRKIFYPLLHSGRDGGSILDVGSWNLNGANVVIIGQGPIGLLFTAMIKNMGANTITGIDLVNYRLEAAVKMGATHVINASHLNTADVVREITHGVMADLVVEAVGEDSTVNDCLALSRRGGAVLVFGVPRESVYKLMFYEFFSKEIKLLGAVGPEVQVEFPVAVELVATDKIDVSHIISHRMPIINIQDAFEMIIDKKDDSIKVLLEF
jgi:L-iditol 2-dehydrogenase